jgi:hypothetical protein
MASKNDQILGVGMIRHCSVISVYVMMYKVQSGIYNSTCSAI